MSYIERHLYDAGGHTDSEYYIRIIRRADSMIWNKDTHVLEAVVDITWAESAILLVEEGLTGVFPIVLPMDRRTVEDIAKELYDARLVDLPNVKKETVSQELYGKPLSELTDGENTLVVVEWETRNEARIAVGTAHQARINIPSGTYDIVVYKVLDSGGDPDELDDVEKQFETKMGSIFGF